MKKEFETLYTVLGLPLTTTHEVFEMFMNEPNVVFVDDGRQKRFLYIEGTRENKVLLVAHADTVWYDGSIHQKYSHVRYDNDTDTFISTNKLTGIGADDRAGIAMLYLLKNSGHSILIVDGEESALIGVSHLKKQYPVLFKNINDIHLFAIELDRRGSNDFKCYDVGSSSFRKFINEETKYKEPDRSSMTDITIICDTMCGVNFSVGYYNEHQVSECLVYTEWLRTYDMLCNLLESDKLVKFSRKSTDIKYVSVLKEDEYFGGISDEDFDFNASSSSSYLTDYYDEIVSEDYEKLYFTYYDTKLKELERIKKNMIDGGDSFYELHIRVINDIIREKKYSKY